MKEIAQAGQPPKILTPEEQDKMRASCRVCSPLTAFFGKLASKRKISDSSWDEKCSILPRHISDLELLRMNWMKLCTMLQLNVTRILHLLVIATFQNLFARMFQVIIFRRSFLSRMFNDSSSSVNEVICHGIPDKRKLREGDIINLGTPHISSCWHDGPTKSPFSI